MALDALSGLTAGFGLVGAGISLYSGLQESKIAQEEAGVESNILGQYNAINTKRQEQAQLEAHRGQMQDIRAAQMARSMAETSSVSQGAQFGSGLQGGLAQISGQVNTNQVYRAQDLTIANSIFEDYANINNMKMGMADLQAKSAEYQGYGAIGGAISGSAPALGKILTSLPGLFA